MNDERQQEGWRGPIYGRVFFALRKRFELGTLECLLLDVVDTLSKRTGWCFASRKYLARILGVSTRSLQRMLASLRAKRLLEYQSSEGRRIRPSEEWRRARVSLRH